MKRSIVLLVLIGSCLLVSLPSWGGDEACTDPPGGPECELPCAATFACQTNADCPDGYECAECDPATLENCTSSNCFCDEEGWVCSGDLTSECIPLVPATSRAATVILAFLLISTGLLARRLIRRGN